MRTSTAFFAGAGTVAIAVAAGLGGGLMIAEGMHPSSQAFEQAKLARSVPETPSPSPTTTSYLAATQAAATTPIKVAPAAAETGPATPVSPNPSPPPQAAVPDATAVPAASSTPASTQAGTAEDVQEKGQDKAAAKAEDADLKARGAERKRVAEQRRTERHRQYVERRRQRREQDLRAVEQAVREDTTPRAYAAQPVGMEGPRFSFFGDD
ncbi:MULTISPECIES: hypothetical protein [unclassified Bradyrhizobium]|uniref:hypothetical protein n=1 Tax=unclassified Bradyrhizobium TaxID=2631580 RepID=UPI002915CF29|nr:MULTISPECIES: hypothetical protein [unclassified Bradyrhizobium]